MNKTNIEWPGLTHTWNPITGCKRACPYCYARRIHERFYKTPFSDIVVHPKRLGEKMPKEPCKIFVGSMSDCEYWSASEWSMVLLVCECYTQHTFMFLSKSEKAYYGIRFPHNCMQGLTITDSSCIHAISHHRCNDRPFLSIEPILGIVPQVHGLYNPYELIIVGAMTGPGATPPKHEWIQSVKDNCPANKIFWKSNIKRFL